MSFNVPKIVIIAVAILTFYVLFFGFFQFDMGMDKNGKMVNCPFSNHSMSICKMNPLEHLQEWQSMFITLPAKDALLLLSTLFGLLALLALKFFSKYSLHNRLQLESYINLFYLKRTLVFNPIQESFSRGILNPKTF